MSTLSAEKICTLPASQLPAEIANECAIGRPLTKLTTLAEACAATHRTFNGGKNITALFLSAGDAQFLYAKIIPMLMRGGTALGVDPAASSAAWAKFERESVPLVRPENHQRVIDIMNHTRSRQSSWPADPSKRAGGVKILDCVPATTYFYILNKVDRQGFQSLKHDSLSVSTLEKFVTHGLQLKLLLPDGRLHDDGLKEAISFFSGRSVIPGSLEKYLMKDLAGTSRGDYAREIATFSSQIISVLINAIPSARKMLHAGTGHSTPSRAVAAAKAVLADTPLGGATATTLKIASSQLLGAVNNEERAKAIRIMTPLWGRIPQHLVNSITMGLVPFLAMPQPTKEHPYVDYQFTPSARRDLLAVLTTHKWFDPKLLAAAAGFLSSRAVVQAESGTDRLIELRTAYGHYLVEAWSKSRGAARRIAEEAVCKMLTPGSYAAVLGPVMYRAANAGMSAVAPHLLELIRDRDYRDDYGIRVARIHHHNSPNRMYGAAEAAAILDEKGRLGLLGPKFAAALVRYIREINAKAVLGDVTWLREQRPRAIELALLLGLDEKFRPHLSKMPVYGGRTAKRQPLSATPARFTLSHPPVASA